MRVWKFRIAISVVILGYLMSPTILSQPNSLSLELNSNKVYYHQDFSNWTDLTVTGDQPTFWAIDSNPATYTSQAGAVYGTYLNLLDMEEFEINESLTIEWDVYMNATNDVNIRRFSRLYCYFNDSTSVVGTLQVWDGGSTVGTSADTGHTTSIIWDPYNWHHFHFDVYKLQNDVYFSLYYDGNPTGLISSKINGALYSITSCSFYAYQNAFGSNDVMQVDNFTITSQNTTLITETVTNTDTTILTETHIVTDTTKETSTETTSETVTATIVDTETSTISPANFPRYFSIIGTIFLVIKLKKKRKTATI